MSSPIEIPSRSRATARSVSPSSSSSSSAGGVYVPVHRRAHSPAASSSSSSAHSSRSGRSTPESDDHARGDMPTYTIHELLHLARSPLSKLPPDAKAAMREVVPDIVLNRKQAETRRWKARQAPSPERRILHEPSHHAQIGGESRSHNRSRSPPQHSNHSSGW